MSYVRTLTICLLLVYFVSAAGCHCFDLTYQIDLQLSAAVLFKIQGKVIFHCTDLCSSLTKCSSTKSLQTRFVVPHKPSIDTFLVIKVIISNDKFIAIYNMKKN